jgi:superfamily II DNA or RNA helicase|tara:strand:+ start:515 stop:1978 length:1464 start_codon:yes stop_codon:yes gene_type:complete
MVRQTRLEIRDEVNIKFHDLDVATRRKLSDTCKYFLPYAYHMPAYKLGRWDGYVRYCDVGGRSYLNLLDKLVPVVTELGYEVVLDDKREQWDFAFDKVEQDTYEQFSWPKKHPAEGLPIILRDYQVEIVNKFLANPQCIQEIATGAGKTLVTAALSHQCEKYGRTIVIVPNKDLVTQTEADYKHLGLDVGVFYGDRKEYNKTHTICTWQSLEILHKKSKAKEAIDFDIGEFIDGVVCVMIDEVHKAKADVLKQLLSSVFSNVPIRWGLTGTIPKDEHEAVACTSTIGPVIGQLSAKELQDRGVLSNLEVNILQLADTHVGFNSYAQELKWITTNPERIEFISQLINGMTDNGNTLILVDRIKTGELLVEQNPDWVFVSGGMKQSERKENYDEVADAEGKVIVATYGVAAVGINIPRIFNLVLIEPGKSFVRVIQSIGRGIRKAKDKDFVNVYDITSTLKYSKKHLTERKKFYKEAEYPFKITKIEYI